MIDHPMSKFNTFILMALLSAGCSKPVPTISTIASHTATKAAPAATVGEEPSKTPSLTSHQAYMIALEYIQKEHKNTIIQEFSVKYEEARSEWLVHMETDLKKSGAHFMVIVSDSEAKVIRLVGGM